MYDVFVSYATPDNEWATRLEQSLTKKGLNVFFDRTRLEAGSQWVPALRQALTDSKNLVALWSECANLSPWVQRELATFDALVNDDPTRRLILVNLQGSNRAYGTMQAITELADAGVYGGGAAAVDAALWGRVVERIERAIDADAGAIPVPLALLTLRQQDLKKFSPELIDRIATGLGITPDELLARYGPTRLDWKPFASDRTIRDMLTSLREQMNQSAQGIRYRWVLEPDDFWAADLTEDAKRFARLFPNAPLSVVVIDAVALHDPHVYKRLMLFQPCLSSQRTAIFVLPPFSGDPRLLRVRQWLKTDAFPYFEAYYEPLQRPDIRVLAQCGFNIADEEDMRRLLLFNLGQTRSASGHPDKPAYLTVGPSQP